MEQHATSIMAEQLQAGLLKLKRRTKYERLDKQLQQLVSSFGLISRDIYVRIYFKRERTLFIFDTYLLNLLK